MPDGNPSSAKKQTWTHRIWPIPPQLVRIIQSGIGGWDHLCHELSWHAAKSLQSDINACVFCVCKLRCVFLTRHVKLLVYPCKCLTFRWSLRHVAQPPKSPSEPLQFVWSLPGAQAWTVYSLPRTARARLNTLGYFFRLSQSSSTMVSHVTLASQVSDLSRALGKPMVAGQPPMPNVIVHLGHSRIQTSFCLDNFWQVPCDLSSCQRRMRPHPFESRQTPPKQQLFFPESVWAQGSSNSGGLYLIFSSSHLLIFTSSLTPSHLHIFSHTFSSSHLLIFTSSLTPSHLHIFSHTFSSSHLLIFTPSHLHTFSSSHLLIFTPSHLHTFSSSHLSSSHLLIFTPSHLHIFSHTFSSSHLLIFTPSHLHIFSHTFSSSHLLSHLLIFTPFSHTFSSSHLLSHLLIFTSSLTPSHLHIFSHTFSSSHLLSHLLIFTPSLTPSHLHTLLSHLLIFTSSLSPSHSFLSPFSLSFLISHFFSLSPSLSFSSLGRGWYSAVRHETSTPFARNEGRSAKTEVKLRFDLVPEQPFRHEMRVVSAKTEVKLRFDLSRSNPFARNEGRSAKTEVKLRFDLCLEQPFRTKWGSIGKNWGKIATLTCAGATLSHEMGVDRQKLR